LVADPEQEVRSLAKKVLWILFAVVLVLALAVAGVTGYFWYQNNHIFVEDAHQREDLGSAGAGHFL